jgi:hypothetical protein
MYRSVFLSGCGAAVARAFSARGHVPGRTSAFDLGSGARGLARVALGECTTQPPLCVSSTVSLNRELISQNSHKG